MRGIDWQVETIDMRRGLSETQVASVKRIVVGLGNPGEEYVMTRHNLGFRAVDAVAAAAGVSCDFQPLGKSRVKVVELVGTPVLLAKPWTYMNLSGAAVEALLTVTGLSNQELLVIHDEMDLPVGRAKMKIGGGAAGHKGVADIVDRCGESFCRVKIGIGRPDESGEDAGVRWVLSEPAPSEEKLLSHVLSTVVSAVQLWVSDGAEKAMTWFNSAFRLEEEGSAEGLPERRLADAGE